MKLWATVGLALLPLALLAAVLVAAAQVGFPDGETLPAEDLGVERVLVTDEGFVVRARVGGPDAIEVAQVAVNDLYVGFEADPPGPVPRLRAVEYTVPYRWVEGEPYEIALVTAGGFRFTAEVEAAHPTPTPDARTLGILALLGVYVGVIPVLAGLLWRPLVGRASARTLEAALGFTLGLLIFLALDTAVDALEIAEEAPAVFEPIILLVAGAVAAYVGLRAAGEHLRARPGAGAAAAPMALALLVAVGIGLHNLAEGLAIGGAFALGQAALGVALVVGFAIHNTTEGLALVAPLGDRPVRLAFLAGLGLVAGGPTVIGAWIGGLSGSVWLALAFLAVGVGAIAAVVVEVDAQWGGRLRRGAGLAGAAVGFLFMYATSLAVVV